MLPVVGIGSFSVLLSADSIGAARFAKVVWVVSLAGQLPPEPELLVVPDDEVADPLDEVPPPD